LDVKLET